MAEETIEAQAEAMGWSPKEKFRGDPEKWIPAEEFVRRGEELLPIVRADNRKLRDEVGNLKGETQSLKAQLKAAQESIEALKEFNSAANREKVEQQRRETAKQLKEAETEGDTERALELRDRLDDQTAALREAKAAPKAPEPPKEDPVFTEWKAANPWYGTDRRKTAFATGVAEELRANGETVLGRAFLDRVAEEVEKQFGGRPTAGKVEGDATPSSAPRGTRGKSYGDLPAEAKAACDRMASRLVGDGRAFKTINDWRKHYAAEYAWE